MSKFYQKIGILVLFFSYFTLFSQTGVVIDPSLNNVNVGGNVTVTFRINNVVNLHSWTIRLKWDNTKIKFNNAYEGPFLNSTYSTFFGFQPATSYITDSVTVTDAILGPYTVSGSGILFTMSFAGLANGVSPLNMIGIWLYDQYLNPISYSSNSGIVAVGPFVTANIKVLLQGPYNTGTGLMNTYLNSSGYLPLNQPYNQAPWYYTGTESVSSTFFASNPNIVDWILLEFRSSPTTVVSQVVALLKNDGTIVDYRTGSSVVVLTSFSSGSYYVVVRYINHLAVMSGGTTALNSSSPLFNFTTSLSQYYGGSAVQLSTGVYGMYAGDVDGNGFINAGDRNLAYNDRGLVGYLKTDVDRNGFVNAGDRNICYNNRGVVTQVP